MQQNEMFPEPKKAEKKDPHAPAVTGTYVPLCHCDVLPWEDCEHTEAKTQQAMKEILGL